MIGQEPHPGQPFWLDGGEHVMEERGAGRGEGQGGKLSAVREEGLPRVAMLGPIHLT